LIFCGMALATYFTRYTMIAVLGREMYAWGDAGRSSLLQRWLRYVPPAVLAALVVPAALAPQGHLRMGPSVWAVLLATVVAWRSRSVLWTIAAGMAAFWLFRALGL
jgi:branched-subunit amino acid transport protein